MNGQQDKEMASWAVNALSNVQIVGSQAQNLLAVQGWLSQIASGEALVLDKDDPRLNDALEDTAGASG